MSITLFQVSGGLVEARVCETDGNHFILQVDAVELLFHFDNTLGRLMW